MFILPKTCKRFKDQRESNPESYSRMLRRIILSNVASVPRRTVVSYIQILRSKFDVIDHLDHVASVCYLILYYIIYIPFVTRIDCNFHLERKFRLL